MPVDGFRAIGKLAAAIARDQRPRALQAVFDLSPHLLGQFLRRTVASPLAAGSSARRVPIGNDDRKDAAITVLPIHLLVPKSRLRNRGEAPSRVGVIDLPV